MPAAETYRVPVPRTRNEPKSATIARARVPPYCTFAGGTAAAAYRLGASGEATKGYACAGRVLRGSRAHDGVLARGRGTRVRYGYVQCRYEIVLCRYVIVLCGYEIVLCRYNFVSGYPFFLDSARSDLAGTHGAWNSCTFGTWCGCCRLAEAVRGVRRTSGESTAVPALALP